MAGNVGVEESEKKYGGIVTDIGAELMMNAVANGGKVKITEFAVGDGNGAYYIPQTDMTELKRECWRGSINSCEIQEGAENILVVRAVCPADVGGFTVREMAVFDEGNNMIAICNSPETPKVKVTDGVVTELRLTLEVALINGEAVELLIDPNIVTATKKDVEEIWKEIEANGKVTIGTTETELEKNEIRFIVDEMPY